MLKYLTLLLFIFVLSSCGTTQTNSKSKYNTGYLIDSPVQGVEYYCNDLDINQEDLTVTLKVTPDAKNLE